MKLSILHKPLYTVRRNIGLRSSPHPLSSSSSSSSFSSSCFAIRKRSGSESESDADADDDSDPVVRKFHYIDPGMIQYQRASFEQMFHSLVVPLTGYELRRLVEGRRLKLSVEDSTVLLLIFQDEWKDATDESWNSIAELLTDWTAEKIVREVLPTVVSCMDTITEYPIKISLRVHHTPKP